LSFAVVVVFVVTAAADSLTEDAITQVPFMAKYINMTL